MLIEKLSPDLIETTTYSEADNKIIVQTTYDNTSVLEENQKARNDQPEFGKYKGNLVRVGAIHLGDVQRLYNMGYDVLSADPDEARRALLYIQSNEPHLLTVTGRPFAKTRAKWV